MIKKKQNIGQMSLIYSFEEQLNHKHPLYRLAEEIQWNKFEEAFPEGMNTHKGKYSDKIGRPVKPIRLMVGLIIR